MSQTAWFKFFFLFSFCFFTAQAFGQQPDFQVTKYDETAGLQSNTVNAMLQDSRGYLWFGTANGLYRYDGYSFKAFKKTRGDSNALPENIVLKLAEDRSGKIWIGLAKEKISCYDPGTGLFKNFNVRNADGSSRIATYISMLFIDKANNIWAGFLQKGFIKLDPATGKVNHYDIIPDTSTVYSNEFRNLYNSAYDMYEERPGIYWLATHDGLCRFNSVTKELIPVRAKPLQKNEFRDDLFGSILADENGLWLGSWAGGLSYYNLKTKQWSNYKFNQRNKNVATTNIISDLKYKSKNQIWVTSNDKGLGIFNTITHSFLFFENDSTGIPDKLCFHVMQDNQDNVWMAYQDGLLKIRKNESKFKYISVPVTRTDNGQLYAISSMLEDREGRWLFTGTSFGDGLHITDKRTGISQTLSFAVSPDEENILEVVDMMQDSKGIIWILTRDFVYQYDTDKNKLTPVPQPPAYMNGMRSNWFVRIKEDKTGKIWIASERNGVFCYDPQAKNYHHYYNDPAQKNSLPSNVISGIAVDGKDHIWISGTRGCFGYFDKSKNSFINLDQNARPSDKISDNRVFTLYADNRGDIWSGTDAGLFFYNTHGSEPKLIKMYDSESGLAGDITTCILEDRNGDIWCRTATSICKLNKATNVIITFGKPDGITRSTSYNCIYQLHDGRMSILSTAGYYIFDPSAFETRNVSAPLVITSFKIDDKEQFFDGSNSANKRITVHPNANVISVEYAALDFVRPDKQEYTYMLEPFDKDWVSAGQRRYAGYANIPGGDYVFKVKATNTAGNWDVPVISIPIHVETPFYKQWWFLLLAAATIFGSLYALYKFKLKRQQQILQLRNKASELEKEKTLVMYESLKQHLNPHFLFNSLTSLSSLIRFDQKTAVDFLDGLSKIYRYILKNKDTETVSLVEEIKFVQTFIQLQQTRFEHGLLVNINVDEEYNFSKIAPVTLQNLIENAIKHNIIDKESPLVIDIFTTNNYLVVRNNLQKKNFVETSNRQGLVNLKSLYNYLSNMPVIITEDEQYFSVKIPLI